MRDGNLLLVLRLLSGLLWRELPLLVLLRSSPLRVMETKAYLLLLNVFANATVMSYLSVEPFTAFSVFVIYNSVTISSINVSYSSH